MNRAFKTKPKMEKVEFKVGQCWMSGSPETYYKYKNKVYGFIDHHTISESIIVCNQIKNNPNHFTAGSRW